MGERLKMKKKIVYCVLLILFVFSAMGIAACGGSLPELVDFKNGTAEIGYGQSYTLDLTVKDENGGFHPLTATVKSADGKDVEVFNGRFVANEKTDYIITYSCLRGKDEQTRTVTVRVVAAAKPIINLRGSGSPLLVGMDYVLPQATVYDYFDGDLPYTVKVMKKNAAGDTEVDFDAENGVYTTTETGEFYIEYSAVNSNGIKNTATLDINVVEPDDVKSIIVVDEDNADLIENKDIADQVYVAADADELDGIEGDYHGNAKRIRIYSNGNYKVKSNYSAALITEMAKYYNSVTAWIAITGIETEHVDEATGESVQTGDAYMMPLSFFDEESQKWVAVPTVQTLAMGDDPWGLKANQNKWIKMVIPTERFAVLATNGEYLTPFYIWCDNMYGVGYVYIGDIVFENVDTPTPPEPVEQTVKVENDDIAQTYLTKEEWTADGITGEYEGNAVRFRGGVNSSFRYLNEYDAEELATLKESYNRVNLKVAFDFSGGALYLFATGYEGIYDPETTMFTESNGKVGVWLTWTVSIEDYIELVAANDYAYFIPWGNAWAEGINSEYTSYYFGELSFEYVAEQTVKVENADIAQTYLTKEEWTADGIAGEYEGNAVRFSGGINSSFRYLNEYDAEELATLKKSYNRVNLKVAFDFDGVLYLFATGYEGIYDPTTTAISGDKVGVWLTWTVSIDDYIELVAANDYAYFIPWGNAWSDNVTSPAVVYYFGELSFSFVEQTEPSEPSNTTVDENGDHLQPWGWN